MDAIRERWQEGVNRPIVKLPTGMGKTPLFAALPDYLNLQKRLMVLVHREELAQQAADKLRVWNPGRSVGVEMGDSYAPRGCDLVVAGVATIGRGNSRRLERFNPRDFSGVVTDECHHATSTSYMNVFKHMGVLSNPSILSLGVTATVNRTDGTGLNKVYQEIVYEKSILDGIKEGWLSDLIGIRVTTGTSLDGVHMQSGDFAKGELGTAVNTPRRNDLAVRSWLEHGNNKQTLVFSVDIRHAKDLADAFKAYGVPAEAIWGDDPLREEKLKHHRGGGLKVLVNCQLLTEGYDDWRVGCIVLTRPTTSTLLYTQMIGRGTRIPEGISNLVEAKQRGLKIEKDSCILIDMVDVASRHSLVSLPSLFGLGGKFNLKKTAITTVMKQVDEIQKDKPFVNPADFESLDQLKAHAERANLFTVGAPPEIIQLSKYQWRRYELDSYVLSLANKEHVSVFKDMLDLWHVIGTVNTKEVKQQHPSFEVAIRNADRTVKSLGGRGLEQLVSRDAKWHNFPPTDKQLMMCRVLRIPVDSTMTRGQISTLIDARIGRKPKVA